MRVVIVPCHILLSPQNIISPPGPGHYICCIPVTGYLDPSHDRIELLAGQMPILLSHCHPASLPAVIQHLSEDCPHICKA